MESGDGPGATDILKELLSVRADRDDLWRLLSNMLKASSRRDEAKTAFAKLLELSPDDAATAETLANLLIAGGMWDQCWELVELLNEWGYHRVSEGLLVTFMRRHGPSTKEYGKVTKIHSSTISVGWGRRGP